MYLMQRLGLVLAAGACLLFAAFWGFRFAIEAGVSSPYFVAQDALMALAGILGMVVCWRKGAQLQARRQAELAAVPAFAGTRFEARARTGMQVATLLASALGTVASLAWLVRAPGLMPLLATALLAALTGLLALVVRSLRRGDDATLKMDAYGLDHAWFGRVPWENVLGLRLHEQKIRTNYSEQSVWSLQLGVEGAAAYVARMPPLARTLAGAVPAPGALSIPLNPLDRRPHEIFEAARSLRARVAPAPIAAWYPGMSAEDIAVVRDIAALEAATSPEEALARMQELAPRIEAMGQRTQAAVRGAQRQARVAAGVAVALVVLVAALALLRLFGGS